MKNSFKLFVLFSFLAVQNVFAQGQEPEMADVMRANGKIYVVVGIIVIVLAGLFIYLFALDRKITRLENKLDSKK